MATRAQFLEDYTQIVESNPIVLQTNLDESAAGAHNTKDKQKDRGLAGYATSTESTPVIPSASFDHLTHFAGISVRIKDIMANSWEAAPNVSIS